MKSRRIRIPIIILALLIITGSIVISKETQENWPETNIKDEYKPIVETALADYKLQNRDYKSMLQKYDVFGDYLNWGITKDYSPSETIKLDEKGIPMVKYGETFYYNPGTIAQYALTMYGKFIHGDQDPAKFLIAVEKLIELQADNGCLPYPFAWKYYLEEKEYSSGWYSAMDSGQALSVYARAYHITKDKKYLEYGNKAFGFLITPVSNGGVMDTLADLDPTLDQYIIFEEYLTKPTSYTLNGFMFALMGLYDWSQIDSDTQDQASTYFKKGIKTLEKILPYYDIGGFTAYDLGYFTRKIQPHVGVGYHAIHVAFCNIFYQLTSKEVFMDYYKKWAAYVDK